MLRNLMSLLLLLSISFGVSAASTSITGDNCKESDRLPREHFCISNEVVDCRHPLDTLDGQLCGSARLNYLNQKLNFKYNEVIKRLSATDTQTERYSTAIIVFVEAHKLWEKFVEKDCSIRGELNLQGTGNVSESLDCMMQHTKARIKELDSDKYK